VEPARGKPEMKWNVRSPTKTPHSRNRRKQPQVAPSYKVKCRCDN
jgi:hypothetical protein